MIFKNKKGDLTAKQLITIIILVVSFSIILIFFFMLNLGGEIDAQSCRNSVVLKNIPVFGRITQFKCETAEVTISETEPQEIYKELAELQRECFWMMGEGKIDIGDGVCAICSIIEFDTGDDGLKSPSQEGYYTYLENLYLQDKNMNYLEYFYDYSSWGELKAQLIEKKIIPSSGLPAFDLSKDYMMFYGYSTSFEWEFSFSLLAIGHHVIIGISPYNANSVANLKCEDFATKL